MRVNNYLIFENVNTRDFHIGISGENTFDSPERNMEFVNVPGRDGALTIDGRSFKNITVSYPAFIARDFDRYMQQFRAKMRALTGYHRLEDTYDEDHFRYGVLTGTFKPKPGPWNTAAEFTISFNCKPQRYLKSGERQEQLTSGQKLINPTEFASKPWIRVYGAGTINIGDVSVTVQQSTDYTDIDCDLQDAVRGLENRNQYVQLQDGKYPSLDPGETTISWTGFSQVWIAPRWWTI